MQENLVKAIQTKKIDFDVEKAFGTEPSWEGITGREDNYRSLVTHALTWANAAFDHEELKQHALEYAISINKNIDRLAKMPSWKFMQIGKIAWLANNGCPITEDFITKLTSGINQLATEDFIEEEPAIETIAKRSRTENRTKLFSTKASELMSWIDEITDSAVIDNTPVDDSDVYRKLSGDKLDIRIADIIYNRLILQHKHYEKEEELLNRLKEDAIIEEFDSREVFESYLSDIGLHKDALVSVLNQIGSYLGNKKALKKSERKLGSKIAVKRLENQVSKVNFKVHDTAYQVSSISPASIVGAPTFVAFNTKNRKLSVYVAKDETGLDIKGTSIHNYDEEKSYQILLKRSERLKEIQSQTASKLKYIVSGIRAKTDAVTGRINEHTILLKAYKDTYPE